jgi:FtsH-binding integral membrane protein
MAYQGGGSGGGYNPNTGYPQGGAYPQPNYGQPQPPPSNVGWATGPGDEYSRLSGAPPGSSYNNQPGYAEAGEAPKASMSFNDASIRAAFVRKVFFLVTIMLGVVAVMSAIPFIHPPMQNFVRQNMGLYWVGYGTFFVTYLVLMCCESVRRSFPANLIVTGILTLAIGYMTMMICSVHKVETVMLTLVITTVVCASIIIFSMQTKYDLTSMMGFVFIASMVIMVFGFVAIIGGLIFHIRWLYMVYAGLAALLFMVYLAIDVQMIMGGKKYSIDPEDHIFAAIQVFMDIIYIFWMLLSLIGGSRSD